jgi:hypothetical protein
LDRRTPEEECHALPVNDDARPDDRSSRPVPAAEIVLDPPGAGVIGVEARAQVAADAFQSSKI